MRAEQHTRVPSKVKPESAGICVVRPLSPAAYLLLVGPPGLGSASAVLFNGKTARFKTGRQQMIPMRKLIPLTALLLLAAANTPALAAEDELKADLAKLQGQWRGTLKTEDNTSVWTLDIKGSKAKISVKADGGDEVFKGETEFKLERHGKFKAYTYFNLKILSGSGEGETRLTDGKTKSSLYKLEDDVFTTIGGFREDDTDKPRLIRWEKVSK